jgi:uncharacterized protein (TIGR00251 family)
MDDQQLKIRVTAPPVGGEANGQVVRVLAGQLKVARSKVTVIAGHRSRNKRVRVEGLSSPELWSRLGE